MSNVKSFELVNSATIAACLGLTERRVRQLVDEGVISATKRNNALKFDLIQTVNDYIVAMREDAASKASLDVNERKLIAEAEYRETKVAQEKYKLAEIEGTMHRSDDVRAATEQLVYSIRSMLVAFPGRLAVDVAAVKTAPEAERLIRDEVNRVLTELSQYRYDPDVYAQMVRERQGWREVDNDDEDIGEGG